MTSPAERQCTCDPGPDGYPHRYWCDTMYGLESEDTQTEPLCLAERMPWSACFLVAGHEGDHVWSYNGAV